MLEIDHDLIREADESIAREWLKIAGRFLHENKKFFTYGGYQDFKDDQHFMKKAEAIHVNLSACAKCLLRKGGVVPAVLHQATLCLEKLQFMVGRPTNYETQYQYLGGKMISEEEQIIVDDIRILGFTTMRAALMRTGFGPTEKPEGAKKKGKIPITKALPHTLSDALHLVLSAESKQVSDLGWVAPYQKIEPVPELKIAEGGSWRIHQIAELVRGGASRTAGLEMDHFRRLTLVSEAENIGNISRGKRPSFNDGEIAFETPLMTRLSQDDIEAHTESTHRQIIESAGWLAEIIAKELQLKVPDDNIARGGRPGLHLSKYYL